MGLSRFFNHVSNCVARAAGDASAFVVCVMLIALWAVSGPFFHFSDTWQLVINTTTTIITFLMVFLIQNTQNRDGAAIQAKLDELIRVSQGENRFIGIENLTQGEVDQFRRWCEARAKDDDSDVTLPDPEDLVARANRKAAAAAEEAV